MSLIFTTCFLGVPSHSIVSITKVSPSSFRNIRSTQIDIIFRALYIILVDINDGMLHKRILHHDRFCIARMPQYKAIDGKIKAILKKRRLGYNSSV